MLGLTFTTKNGVDPLLICPPLLEICSCPRVKNPWSMLATGIACCSYCCRLWASDTQRHQHMHDACHDLGNDRMFRATQSLDPKASMVQCMISCSSASFNGSSDLRVGLMSGLIGLWQSIQKDVFPRSPVKLHEVLNSYDQISRLVPNVVQRSQFP